MKEIRDLPGFSCPHESQGLPTNVRVPDYVPITKPELVELMGVAVSTQDPRLRAQIQGRLGRAIPGTTCPHTIDGPTAEAHTQLDQLYVDELENGPTDGFMEQVSTIIQFQDGR